MKKILILLACTLLGASISAQTKTPGPKKVTPKKTVKAPPRSTALMGYLYATVQPVSGVAGLPVQSFICGSSGNNILIVGGRTNGFHGTDATDSAINFPKYYANTSFIVYNPTTGATTTAPIPAAYADQMSSTNMQGYQEGDTLYGCGGYGKNSAGSYVTYNGFFAISISGMINAILSGSTSNLSQYIVSTSNNYAAVTGGEMLKMGNYFYLVFGQNFTGLYAPPPTQNSTQTYTNAIRQFSVNNTGSALSVALVDSFTDGNSADSNSRFHRRDLNVVPIINTDGNRGIAVYGGVFTQKVNGVWQNPVYITQGANNTTNVNIDNSYAQQCNQYACAQVPAYDPVSGTMVTTLIGGISYYAYNGGQLQPDPAVPFSKIITSIFRYSNGTTVENYTGPQLADFSGAESHFFPLPAMLYSDGIIDLSKIPLNGGPVTVGYMYGGIKATASQSSTINPTMANKTLYQVTLTRWIPVEKKAK